MTLTVGIDEVGYGPHLGPLVVVAAGSVRPLGASVRIADSKKIFSQARGVASLEAAVLGFLPSATFEELLGRLGSPLPDAPWYRTPLPLPAVPPLGDLAIASARFAEPAEFNASLDGRNKSDVLFDLAADLICRVREERDGPIDFRVGKQGGRKFYLADLRRRVNPRTAMCEERRERSRYAFRDTKISFLRDAEDQHELVALASMIGKYVRECAMKLFNDYWARHRPGLRRTAGYGRDGMRFYRDIEPSLARLKIDREAVLRLR